MNQDDISDVKHSQEFYNKHITNLVNRSQTKRLTWEEYSKKNQKQLEMNFGDSVNEDMVKYRQELDKEREAKLAKGKNHKDLRKKLKKKEKKDKKKDKKKEKKKKKDKKKERKSSSKRRSRSRSRSPSPSSSRDNSPSRKKVKQSSRSRSKSPSPSSSSSSGAAADKKE